MALRTNEISPRSELDDGSSKVGGALTSINLFNSSLTSLPEGLFRGLGALTSINMSSCHSLTSLPEGLFRGLGALPQGPLPQVLAHEAFFAELVDLIADRRGLLELQILGVLHHLRFQLLDVLGHLRR